MFVSKKVFDLRQIKPSCGLNSWQALEISCSSLGCGSSHMGNFHFSQRLFLTFCPDVDGLD